VQFVRTPDECFANLPGFPLAPHYVEVGDGLRMHYVDEGPRHGEVVLLVHGQPTWSYLYRTVIPPLTAAGLRVIAPDLVGFGRSDKPLHRADHSVRNQVRWLGACLEALELPSVTAVVQDWGGPIGLGAFSQVPSRLRRVVAANTTLHTADSSLAGRLSWPCHAGEDGTMVVASMLLDYQRMTQELTEFRPGLFVQGATASEVPPAVLAAYDAPFPDEEHCAGPRQLPLLMALTPHSECARVNRATWRFLASFDGPFLTAFSDGDPATRGWDGVLQELVPGARAQRHHAVAGAGHFLWEDRGGELGALVARFVRETP
jgi:haloalkane dehalogenase